MGGPAKKLIAPLEERLPDQEVRDRAVLLRDRNVIVSASAGTGKTRLLAERLLCLTLGTPRVPMDRIVAMTFTEKAASEMKQRVRDALRLLGYGAQTDADEGIQRLVESVRRRLPKEELKAAAREALTLLEQTELTTIHSFATSLLRRYPIPAGIDPSFQVDEGPLWERLFREEWESYLGEELQTDAPKREDWSSVLERVGLGTLRQLAQKLAGFRISEEVLLDREQWSGIPKAFRERLAAFHAEGELLRKAARAAGRGANLPKLIEPLLLVAGHLGDVAGISRSRHEEAAEKLRRFKTPGKLSGEVPPEQFQRIETLFTEVKALLAALDFPWEALQSVLVPVAQRMRRRAVREGILTFDALLSFARDLLRDDLRVRQECKARYQAVLVDEVQDTDPVQGELLLYLCERWRGAARKPSEVALEPGKLFLVGDFKQSIFGWRNADLEAVEALEQRALRQGERLVLETNFRSQPRILDAVNDLFREEGGALMQARRGIQPPYEPLTPSPRTELGGEVVFLTVRPQKPRGETGEAPELFPKAREGHLAEARAVAMDIRRRHRQGFAFRDMAILMRSTTHLDAVLDALREKNLPYAVHGERHFYYLGEVVEFFHGLRALAYPDDSLSLFGWLRSRYVGSPDADLELLARRGSLTRLSWEAGLKGSGLKGDGRRRLEGALGTLDELGQTTAELPLDLALSEVLRATGALEIAAGFHHGEQAVANLMKFCSLAYRVPDLSFRQFVDWVEQEMQLQRRAGESPLAEEGLDAVRLFTMHGAKGLEFDVVYLIQSAAHSRTGGSDTAWVTFDHPTQSLGMKLGELLSPGGSWCARKARELTAAERVRLLYVAMTRARKVLVLSRAMVQHKRGSPEFARLLETGLERLGCGWPDASRKLPFPSGDLKARRKRVGTAPPHRKKGRRAAARPQPFARRWRKWSEAMASVREREGFARPSRETVRSEAERGPERSFLEEEAVTRAAAVGTLCHQVLERLDWASRQGWRELLALEYRGARGTPGFTETALREAEGILEGFLQTPTAARLSRAELLGREVPVLADLRGGQFVRGVVDLVYREKDGTLVAADYKTSAVKPGCEPEAAERYRPQAAAYARAVSRALGGAKVRGSVIFLRTGAAVRL